MAERSLRKKRVGILLSVLMCIAFLLMSSVRTFADTLDTATYSQDVATEMTSNVSMSGTEAKKYTTSGGGYYTATNLLMKDSNNVVVIDENKYSELTSSSQTEFVSDLNKAATNVVNKGTNNCTSESQTNWYKIIQQQDGVGSKFMNVILENTKPDFVTANRIYQPFSGIVGTVMGLFAVLIMAFLGIVMVSDIAYITLPPVRLFVADDDKGSGVVKSKLFSHDAIYAVRKAEEDSDSNGSPKQALGIYFKRRIFMLILLGLCLMYLIQGQIYTLVGYILDLLRGFIGF